MISLQWRGTSCSNRNSPSDGNLILSIMKEKIVYLNMIAISGPGNQSINGCKRGPDIALLMERKGQKPPTQYIAAITN